MYRSNGLSPYTGPIKIVSNFEFVDAVAGGGDGRGEADFRENRSGLGRQRTDEGRRRGGGQGQDEGTAHLAAAARELEREARTGLERALVEYQHGDRKNPVMATFIGQLSDAEIKAVADYYAAQSPALKTLLRRNWL